MSLFARPSLWPKEPVDGRFCQVSLSFSSCSVNPSLYTPIGKTNAERVGSGVTLSAILILALAPVSGTIPVPPPDITP